MRKKLNANLMSLKAKDFVLRQMICYLEKIRSITLNDYQIDY
jgi:hypothetical protein